MNKIKQALVCAYHCDTYLSLVDVIKRNDCETRRYTCAF